MKKKKAHMSEEEKRKAQEIWNQIRKTSKELEAKKQKEQAEKDANKAIEKLININAAEEQEEDTTSLNKAQLARQKLMNDLKDYEFAQVFALFMRAKTGKYYKKVIPEDIYTNFEELSDLLEEYNYDLLKNMK